MARTGIILVTTCAAMIWLAACRTNTNQTASSEQATPAARSASTAVKKNACDLVDRAEIEGIAGIKLEMLHDIQEEDKTVCEMREPGNLTPLVSVTVYWKGGKQRANSYSDAIPSWLIKDDVLVELASPSFDADKTKALFVSISKTALPKL